jgi:hypothetical protein
MILLLALTICVWANFSLRAYADSTAGLIVSMKCQGGYNINLWKKHSSVDYILQLKNLCQHYERMSEQFFNEYRY